MIKSFAHKGLERFYLTGNKSGIQAVHAKKLSIQLAALNHAEKIEDMDVPGWRLHSLRGILEDHWSVVVSANWRLTFKFDGKDATVVNYQDYH